jgi:hemolysin D
MSHIRRLMGAAPTAFATARSHLAATPVALDRLRSHFARRLHAEEAEFLTGIHAILHAPVPLAARLFPAVLMALFAITLLWAFASEMDVVSSTQGKIIPSTRVKLIQSMDQAMVKAVLVREGQAVQEGDPLVVFDDTVSAADRDRAQRELEVNRARAARLHLLAGAAIGSTPALGAVAGVGPRVLADEQVLTEATWRAHTLELRTLDPKIENMRADIRGLEAEVSRLNALIDFSTRRAERMRTLTEKGHATRASLDDAEEELVERKFELATKKETIIGKRADIALTEEEKKTTREKFRQQQLEELSRTEREISSLEKELLKLEHQIDQRVLHAPIDGTVLDLDIHTEGGVVQPAAVLMKVVPKETPLEVEAQVLNRDIGFVQPGQHVKVKVETFTFTKYGAITGIVRKVAQDATHDDKLGTIYRTLIDLEHDTIEVDGRAVRLKPGMNAVIDIETGRRRVIEYILTPILKYQDEALRER